MASFRFRCTDCDAVYGEDRTRLTCDDCGRKQVPGASTRGVLAIELDDLPTRWPEAAPASDGFLRAFLPLRTDAELPPLVVGGTPLLPVPELRRALAMPRLWLKDDTRNPSGSTKDRASLLVVSKALEYGYDVVACASTGNAATALAAVAAAAGIRAVVLVPADAPEAKLIQMLAYGARVLRVDGSYDQAYELCRQACERLGWYNRNTALNPFSIEGKKTAALEIARDLAPDAPDVVVVPVGDGVILAGLAKGFADLVRCGLLCRLPRLIAVQPAGSDAIVRALRDGRDDVTPTPGAASVADSLVVETPRGARPCLRAIRASGGAAVAVADDAILAAIPRLARHTGVFPEPAAAAALAGLDAALDQGLVARDERVVLMVTGTGLKNVSAAARAVRRPEPVAPTLEALIERLQS